MAENKDIKYPLKSEKYDGVFQRKNGQWFYRIKKIIKEGEEPWVCQKSNYPTEDAAYMAKVERIQRELINRNYEELIKDYPEDENAGLRVETFETVFNMFIEHCGSDSSVEKYEIIYNSLLKRWADRKIGTFSNNELEAFLLKLSMGRKSNGEKYSEGYIDSVRKLITKVFEFAIENDHTILGHIGQTLNERDYKLRVLSLFSGIGAPEQAMKNMDIDFDLINFCEIDKKASKAYCLLHGEPNVNSQGFNDLSAKNLNDISKIDMNDFRDNILDPDIVYFGFPCTDLSQLGKQKGFYSDDKNCNFPSNLEIYTEYEIDGQTRSGLLINVLRMVMHKKPKFLIAENVAALVSSKFEKAFNEVILRFKNMDDIGYHVHYVVLNSKEFGVPQSRKRVFMIMVRGDILGNDDWFEYDSKYHLTQDEEIKGQNFIPFEFVSITPFNTNREANENKLTYELNKLKADSGSIIVAHTPPYGFGDLLIGGNRCGSKAVREWIETVQPKMWLCGHIHENNYLGFIGDSLICNCACWYQNSILKGWLIDTVTMDYKEIEI